MWTKEEANPTTSPVKTVLTTSELVRIAAGLPARSETFLITRLLMGRLQLGGWVRPAGLVRRTDRRDRRSGHIEAGPGHIDAGRSCFRMRDSLRDLPIRIGIGSAHRGLGAREIGSTESPPQLRPFESPSLPIVQNKNAKQKKQGAGKWKWNRPNSASRIKFCNGIILRATLDLYWEFPTPHLIRIAGGIGIPRRINTDDTTGVTQMWQIQAGRSAGAENSINLF